MDTRGAPLTNCTPSHFHVPRTHCNEVSNTHCEDQKNQHLQLANPTTLQGQQVIPTIDITQQLSSYYNNNKRLKQR